MLEPESAITGLDLLFLEVNNLGESLTFYHDQIGFVLERQNLDAEPPTATLRGGSFRLTLVQQPESMLRRGRGVNLFFGVRDVDRFYQDLKERGIQLAKPLDEGWGGRFVTVQDPDKYRLFFVTWSHET